MKLWKRGLRAAGVWLINKSGEPHVTSVGSIMSTTGGGGGGGGGGAAGSTASGGNGTVFPVTIGQGIVVRLPGGGGSGIREW